MLASIDEMEFSLDKSGDIQYSLKLKEFPEGYFDFVARDKDLYSKVKKYIDEYVNAQDKKAKLEEYKLFLSKKFPRFVINL